MYCSFKLLSVIILAAATLPLTVDAGKIAERDNNSLPRDIKGKSNTARLKKISALKEKQAPNSSLSGFGTKKNASIMELKEQAHEVYRGPAIDPDASSRLLKEKKRLFSSRTHQRNHNLNIELKLPKSWSAEEDEDEQLLQIFTGAKSSTTMLVATLQIAVLRTYEAEYLAEVFSSDKITELKNFTPSNSEFIACGKGTKENSAWFSFKGFDELSMHAITFVHLYDKKMIMLQCAVISTESLPRTERTFNSYLKFFTFLNDSMTISKISSVK